MDNETLRLIARLKGIAARAGLNIDVVRFAADRSYALSSMQQFAGASDEAGALLVLQLMDRLGFTAAVPAPEPPPAPPPPTPAPPPVPAAADTTARYVGRLR